MKSILFKQMMNSVMHAIQDVEIEDSEREDGHSHTLESVFSAHSVPPPHSHNV